MGSFIVCGDLSLNIVYLLLRLGVNMFVITIKAT